MLFLDVFYLFLIKKYLPLYLEVIAFSEDSFYARKSLIIFLFPTGVPLTFNPQIPILFLYFSGRTKRLSISFTSLSTFAVDMEDK